MLAKETKSRLISAGVFGLIVALFFPFPASGEYAEFGYRLAEIGPTPDRFSFRAYDADTGAFLYGIQKAKCDNLQLPLPDGTMRSWDSRQTALQMDRWDVGPSLPDEEWAALGAQLDRAWSYYCDDSSPTGSTQAVSSIRADAGRFPQFQDRQAVSDFGVRVRVPMSAMGPDYMVEHRLRLEGDPFAVRIWSGVGLRDRTCQALDPEATWRLGLSWADDQSLLPTDRHYLMCVSYRFLGALGAPDHLGTPST